MDHGESLRPVQQRQKTQPLDQVCEVWRAQHVLKRVLFTNWLGTCCNAQQMQVVVSQDSNSPVSETPNKPQHAERIRASINEVSHKPEVVASGIESNPVEQSLQCLEVTLDVTYGIDGHSLFPLL
jgi:hypothetical protein